MGTPARSGPDRRRWSVPVLTIGGVTIRVHVTFLALVALIAASASETGKSPVGAVAWLVVLFACVVVHELAHSFVARSKGIAVHEIDLLPIGGVSRMERIPDDWREERDIAIAGPLASVALALLAFAVAATAGLDLLPVDPWEGPLLVRLVWVNLLLAAFNLLPAFPMDGGRVLRAVLERRRSRVDATRLAARVSRVLAAVMIAAGFVSNVWLLVIGCFVLVAGGAEEAAVLVHAALAPTPASALAFPCPVSMPAEMTAGDAGRIAAASPQPAYAVTDAGGRVVGVVTAGQLLGAVPAIAVGSLASTAAVDAADSLEAVAEAMTGEAVAVLSGGRFVGVVTREVLSGFLQQRLHEVGG